MNFKRKLLKIFLISISIIIPMKVDAYSKYLIPGGENIGISVQSEGVFVVGFYPVDGKDISSKTNLKIGDRIVSINDYVVDNVNDLISKFDGDDDIIKVKFGYIRNDKLSYTTMELHKDKNGGYKTGIYVKDTITGIGTLTYINPVDLSYGALGHDIIENESGNNFTLLKGEIFSSKVTSISKSKIGLPGEKNAKLNSREVLGNIKYNIETGIYGTLDKNISNEKIVEVGSLDDAKIGKAEIITVINEDKKQRFEIEILSINKTDDTKNFLIEITDKELLNKTGGIVKGMSGSPIIQNGKIIGAVTHAIVDNPQKGLGISIVKMLESGE